MRFGFAGTQRPNSFPTLTGYPKHRRVMTGTKRSFVGSDAMENRGLLRLVHPFRRGIVDDWNEMEKIWKNCFELMEAQSDLHPVLLTEAPFTMQSDRVKTAEMFFETFQVPCLFFSSQAVLSLYSSGRTTGLVLDSGEGVSYAVPVYEGFAIENAIQRSDLGGTDVTKYLKLLLRKRGHRFETSAETEIVREIKQSTFISLNPNKDSKYLKPQKYTLPDGTEIALGTERFRFNELLFQPDLVGLECKGLQELCHTSLKKSDIDLRMRLQESILLSGGVTLTNGFGERLLSEMQKGKKGLNSKVKIYAPSNREESTWIGGSVLASLGTFRRMWISKEEYDEDPDIVNRKTF